MYFCLSTKIGSWYFLVYSIRSYIIGNSSMYQVLLGLCHIFLLYIKKMWLSSWFFLLAYMLMFNTRIIIKLLYMKIKPVWRWSRSCWLLLTRQSLITYTHQPTCEESYRWLVQSKSQRNVWSCREGVL